MSFRCFPNTSPCPGGPLPYSLAFAGRDFPTFDGTMRPLRLLHAHLRRLSLSEYPTAAATSFVSPCGLATDAARPSIHALALDKPGVRRSGTCPVGRLAAIPGSQGIPIRVCCALRPRRAVACRPCTDDDVDCRELHYAVLSRAYFEAQSHGPRARCLRFVATSRLHTQNSLPAAVTLTGWDWLPTGPQ